MTSTTNGLSAVDVSRAFGALYAVSGANATLCPGQIVALVGPNGAGKTTLLNCLTGTDSPTDGRILLDGVDITKWSNHKRAVAGVRRTFQHARPFGSMTLVENIMSSISETGYSAVDGLLRTPRYRRGEAAIQEMAFAALERVGLADLAHSDPSVLSAGQQRLAEVARAYAAKPRYLLLDEPTSGLNGKEADKLFDVITQFRDEGLGLIVVEHRIQTVAGLANQMIVMEQGKIVASGTPSEIRNSDTVIAAYMGSA